MRHVTTDKPRPKPTGLIKPVSWVLCLKILAIFGSVFSLPASVLLKRRRMSPPVF